jgi:hypothetical protein
MEPRIRSSAMHQCLTYSTNKFHPETVFVEDGPAGLTDGQRGTTRTVLPLNSIAMPPKKEKKGKKTEEVVVEESEYEGMDLEMLREVVPMLRQQLEKSMLDRNYVQLERVRLVSLSALLYCFSLSTWF